MFPPIQTTRYHMTDNAQPAKPSASSDGWAGVIIGTLIIIGLISLGVLPTSCGKILPGGVGKHYGQYCDACGGDGKVNSTCSACSGQGYYAGSRCRICSGSGQIEHSCRFCAGSGKKPTN